MSGVYLGNLEQFESARGRLTSLIENGEPGTYVVAGGGRVGKSTLVHNIANPFNSVDIGSPAVRSDPAYLRSCYRRAEKKLKAGENPQIAYTYEYVPNEKNADGLRDAIDFVKKKREEGIRRLSLLIDFRDASAPSYRTQDIRRHIGDFFKRFPEAQIEYLDLDVTSLHTRLLDHVLNDLAFDTVYAFKRHTEKNTGSVGGKNFADITDAMKQSGSNSTAKESLMLELASNEGINARQHKTLIFADLCAKAGLAVELDLESKWDWNVRSTAQQIGFDVDTPAFDRYKSLIIEQNFVAAEKQLLSIMRTDGAMIPLSPDL